MAETEIVYMAFQFFDKESDRYKDFVNLLHASIETPIEKKIVGSKDGKWYRRTKTDTTGRVTTTPGRMGYRNTETERTTLKTPKKKLPVNDSNAEIIRSKIRREGRGK